MTVNSLDVRVTGASETLSANETERANLEDAIGAIWSSISRRKISPINAAGTPDRDIQCLAIPLRIKSESVVTNLPSSILRGEVGDERGHLFLYRLGNPQELQDDGSGPLSFGTGVIRIIFNAGTDGVRDLRYRYGHGTTTPDEPDQIPWLSEAPLEDLRRLVEFNPGELLDIDVDSPDANTDEKEIASEWSRNYKNWIKSIIDEKMRAPRQ